MLIARMDAASLGWRAFAVLAAVSAGPELISGLGVAGNNFSRNSAFGIVALAGLLGYAYGFRIGPLIIWRLFAVIFSVGLMTRAGTDLGPIAIDAAQGTVALGSSRAVAALLLFGAFLLLCMALFRHARLVGPATSQLDRKDELADIFS